MSIQKVIRQTIDLQAGGGELNWPDSLAVQGEAGGHRWEVTVMDGGRAANLAGAQAKCYVVNGDVTTPQVASIVGNVVSVVFAASCYASSGALRAILRVAVSKDVSPAVALLRLRVHSGITDTVADPNGVIPSLSELLDRISDCEAAEKAASAAASSANAAASNASSNAAAANAAAQTANTAANTANAAAGNANSKANAANAAAQAANTAASTAVAAAAKIDGMTVSASGLAAGAAPTAAVSETGGHKHIAFGIPKGDRGEKGDTGATPNLTMGTVTTGSPADKASATLTGTAENPVLSLTIPQGIPGTGFGTVTSVNNVLPDAAGNVAMNFPRNLLDNSDFTNPVNQRGFSSGGPIGEWARFIDRWEEYAGAAWSTFYFDSSGGILNGTIGQKVINAKLVSGNMYTFAVYFSDGTSVCASGVVTTGLSDWTKFAEAINGNVTISIFSDSREFIIVRLLDVGSKCIKYLALYEGAYTADTLPPYVPKGYAAELAECQRYYVELGPYRIVAMSQWNTYYSTVTFPIQMRANPTVTLRNPMTNTAGTIGKWDNSGTFVDYTGFMINDKTTRGFTIGSDPDGSFTPQNIYFFSATANADL